jgi:hypothetical protein
VEECLDDRPGNLEPTAIVLELENLARSLFDDLQEPGVELAGWGEVLQRPDDFNRRPLQFEELEAGPHLVRDDPKKEGGDAEPSSFEAEALRVLCGFRSAVWSFTGK